MKLNTRAFSVFLSAVVAANFAMGQKTPKTPKDENSSQEIGKILFDITT